MSKTIIFGDQEDTCYICGRYGKMQTHHCLHGIRRKKADEFGLTVHLCPMCHKELHDNGYYDLTLERVAQKAFEKKYSHEKFIEVFGKNYL